MPRDRVQSHYGDRSQGEARHSVRAIRSQAPQDRRARSDAPCQPDKMRIAGLCVGIVATTGTTTSPIGLWDYPISGTADSPKRDASAADGHGMFICSY